MDSLMHFRTITVLLLLLMDLLCWAVPPCLALTCRCQNNPVSYARVNVRSVIYWCSASLSFSFIYWLNKRINGHNTLTELQGEPLDTDFDPPLRHFYAFSNALNYSNSHDEVLEYKLINESVWTNCAQIEYNIERLYWLDTICRQIQQWDPSHCANPWHCPCHINPPHSGLIVPSAGMIVSLHH